MDDKNEKKQGVNIPEHTDSSANQSSKAENIKNAAATGVVRMGDNTVNSLRSEIDGGDEQTDAVQNGLDQGIDEVGSKIDTARNGYDDIKHLRDAMQNRAQQGGTAANGDAGTIQPGQNAGNELATAGDARTSDAAAGAQAADGASKAGFREMSGECSGCVKITYKLAEIRYLFESKMRRQIRIKIRYLQR